jgi:hypothetical protein
LIDDHRDVYGVEPICAVVPIASSTYYDAKRRQADSSTRARRDRQLRGHIRRIWQDNHGVTAPARSGGNSPVRASPPRPARSSG